MSADVSTEGIVVDPVDDESAVLENLLATRWSCRAFEPREVPQPLIERMFTLAQRSASWCNTQPWQVVVTSGAGTERFRDGLAEYAQQHGASFEFDPPAEYRGVYRDRRRASGWQLYQAVGVERGDRAASARQSFENFRLFGAPHVAIITTDAEQGVYGAVDSGLYLGTLLLAARSLGIATIPQAALASQSPFIREHFGIADDRKILVGISFGYADLDHPANSYRTARASLDEVVTWQDR
ncbi:MULTISPECIES: nitroreductase [unclassified Rhodococcus (in: high G+C Gram-positive bacteria)]|uniref:nitroreductase n=1 Tax=unclassified Rhodococcus (in: high G+C Gram-positive bacteria) TaxID=192944 RepID=UPI00163A8896|nr:MULTISPECIES: nitroreductase [unclassified Rhodococcus (in: high G+C Gram-positive bacteria)]MBC2640855.1 nitroreductase [Rhodococcus sp. 3A]MBC2894401.1 nitroreductase [Rhodococcus sp. 4CII]